MTVKNATTGTGPQMPVITFDAIDSTNTEAMRRAASGERGPIWLRADRQLAGKGRSGRQWQSPSGNLSATFLFTPGCPVEHLSDLSFVTAIAVHQALCDIFAASNQAPPAGLEVKWPNDVMIGPAKLAGILIESSIFSGETVVAIGCGMNISTTPPVDGRTVTRLADHGLAPTAATVLTSLANALQHWLAVWNAGENFADIRDAWMARTGPIGALLAINTGIGRVSGGFAGVGSDGALLLTVAPGKVRRFHYGDVTHTVSPATQPDRTE